MEALAIHFLLPTIMYCVVRSASSESTIPGALLWLLLRDSFGVFAADAF